MKKISLVQVNFQQGPKDLNSFYLPYSVGCLWAYANSFDSIQQNYQLDQVLWRRDLLANMVQQLHHSDVVGFSTYVWNRNYNYELARLVKRANPNCFIMFGGPEPAVTDPAVFEKHPYIDAIIVREGEITFKNLLDNLDQAETVPGIVFNKNGVAVDTGPAARIEDITVLPSPYLTGFFDKIIADNPQVLEWSATLETNRGCPYACTFCDWGSLTYNKVKKLDLERIFAEIEWMGQKRIGWMSITDANFGMFVDRDNMILDKFLEVQNRTGYPTLFAANYAKNQKAEVLDMITKIIRSSKNHIPGHKVSIQSLHEPVLDIIKRKNLKLDDCAKIFALAEERGIPIGTEMIMGLPGDSKQTWRESIWKLFKMGLHSNIEMYICQMLENSEMNLVQREVYDIKTVKVLDYMHCPHEAHNEIEESIEVVISNSSMTFDDTVDTAVFNWFITTFHFYGFSNFLSRYLYKSQGVEYEDFYRGLHRFMCQDEYFVQQRQIFKEIVMQWFSQGRIDDAYKIQSFHIKADTMFAFTVLDIHTRENKIQEWFDLIYNYITETYSIEEHTLEELFKLQINAPVLYSQLDQYPKIINFDSNIYEYITSNKNLELQTTPSALRFEFLEEGITSLDKFVESLYYRRLRHFGTAWIKNEN
jgi:radical SAM superfamily enzyme YgiQ (UPF0313 family)